MNAQEAIEIVHEDVLVKTMLSASEGDSESKQITEALSIVLESAKMYLATRKEQTNEYITSI